MNMQCSPTQRSSSSHNIKENFIRKNPSTLRYSDTHQQAQVTSKKPPVSATASSRPSFKMCAPSPAISLIGSSGQNGNTPISCAGNSEQKEILFGAFSSFEERAERARTLAMKVAPEQLRTKPLSEALDTWWTNVKEPSVRKPRTKEAYLLYMKHLKRKLGAVELCTIDIGFVLEYQRERHKVEGASIWLVNHETNTLSQVMRYADLWDRIEKYFRQLPPPDWTPPKVLTHEEEEFFFKIAAANPEWEVTYWGCSLTNNTSAVGCELINLQKKHILISHDPKVHSVIHVPDGKVKNEFRARVIPLNETALKQVQRLLERAERLARVQGFTQLYEEHYIFPRGIARNRFDVTKPASRYFMYNHFYKMRKLTGFKFLCPRNFRNQIITKLFERGTPDETITSIAGHSSIKMSRYYSRIRTAAKFEALSAIGPVGKGVKNAG